MYGDVKTSFNISNTFIPLFLGFSNSKNKAGYSRLDLDEFEEEADYKGEFRSGKNNFGISNNISDLVVT